LKTFRRIAERGFDADVAFVISADGVKRFGRWILLWGEPACRDFSYVDCCADAAVVAGFVADCLPRLRVCGGRDLGRRFACTRWIRASRLRFVNTKGDE